MLFRNFSFKRIYGYREVFYVFEVCIVVMEFLQSIKVIIKQ